MGLWGALLQNAAVQWRQVQAVAVAGSLACIFLAVPSAGAVDALKTCACLLKECRFLPDIHITYGLSAFHSLIICNWDVSSMPCIQDFFPHDFESPAHFVQYFSCF